MLTKGIWAGWKVRFKLGFAGLVALLILDALMGLAYRTNTNASVKVVAARSGMTHRAIVLFPGYVMPGDTLAKAFAPYVANDDALVVVNYAERGINEPDISDKVLAMLHTLKPVELRIYGASMGGMLSKLFLDRYREKGMPYGKVILILDSAPASRNNVKASPFLLDLSCWYRGGPLSSAVWAAIRELQPTPPTEEHADQEIVKAAHHAGAWAGMPAMTSQACFIQKFVPPKPDELLGVAQQVVFLQGHPPDDDPVVRIPAAIAGWRVAFPGVLAVTLADRAGKWHLPLVERPLETVRAITAPR
jgi:hypothetical protein